MRNVLAAALVVTVLLPGCGAFDPKPDPSRFFTLSPLLQPEPERAKTSGAASGISFGVGPVTLPGYLDREEIVVRVAHNRLRLLESDRWAEPLDANIARVISQNIAHFVRAERIHAYPWPIDRRPVYQIEIDVLRFEADAEHQARLSTRWLVRNTRSKDRILFRETRLARPVHGRSTEASVAALSETLAELSREVAAAIQEMDGTQN
jgi:uncharacterized lipoprotein YmbA